VIYGIRPSWSRNFTLAGRIPVAYFTQYVSADTRGNGGGSKPKEKQEEETPVSPAPPAAGPESNRTDRAHVDSTPDGTPSGRRSAAYRD